jgi:hypothetical protein
MNNKIKMKKKINKKNKKNKKTPVLPKPKSKES